MTLGHAGNMFKIVREVNLNTIKAEAEQRFALLVTGEHALAQRLAERLSGSPGKEGAHPWLEVREPALAPDPQELSQYTLALLVSHEAELEPPLSRLLRALHDERVPVVVAIVSRGAVRLVGAESPRRYEGQRVVLPEDLEVSTVQGPLAEALLETAPESLRLALARELPMLRPALARELIESTSRTNAFYAASTGLAEVVPLLTIPLTAADIFVLTKNQLVMAFKLALVSGKEGSPREIIGEVISVLGSGFLFRQIARELVGLIPVVGILPKVAVSYAGTWVIGRTVYLWASEGERVSAERMRRFYDEAIARGQAIAASLVSTMRDKVPALPSPNGAGAEGGEGQGRSLWQRVRAKLPF